MRYIYTRHIETQMRRRKITRAEVEQALQNVTIAYSTPKGSTCMVGVTAEGRVLKVWVVGTERPIPEPWVLKSTAGKDEEDD